MKQILPALLLFSGGFIAHAQLLSLPDTLLLQTFTVDPSDTMLDFPSGNDQQWVNWDADNQETLCGQEEPVPGNWFWENDLGDLSDPPVNFAFTSCSFLANNEQPNENWLITPPVFITDSTATLSWRSAPFEGPAYMDGYKVLVSTTTNEPFLDAFTDTLFIAAEMTEVLKNASLDPDDHLFSAGYIHANRYTDTNYFFLILPNAKAYTGRLEPHQVSLAKYMGRSIYIGFLHDSQDDSILQIDDITILQDKSSPANTPVYQEFFLRATPNPALDFVIVSWQTTSSRPGRLVVSDILGKTMLEQAVPDMSAGTVRLDLAGAPAGMYTCALRTSEGFQTVLFAKR